MGLTRATIHTSTATVLVLLFIHITIYIYTAIYRVLTTIYRCQPTRKLNTLATRWRTKSREDAEQVMCIFTYCEWEIVYMISASGRNRNLRYTWKQCIWISVVIVLFRNKILTYYNVRFTVINFANKFYGSNFAVFWLTECHLIFVYYFFRLYFFEI